MPTCASQRRSIAAPACRGVQGSEQQPGGGGAALQLLPRTVGGTTSILLFLAGSQGHNQDLQKICAIPLPLRPLVRPTCSAGSARKALITLSLRAVGITPWYSNFVIKPGSCSVHLSWHHHRHRHIPIPPKELHACQVVLVDVALS